MNRSRSRNASDKITLSGGTAPKNGKQYRVEHFKEKDLLVEHLDDLRSTLKREAEAENNGLKDLSSSLAYLLMYIEAVNNCEGLCKRIEASGDKLGRRKAEKMFNEYIDSYSFKVMYYKLYKTGKAVNEDWIEKLVKVLKDVNEHSESIEAVVDASEKDINFMLPSKGNLSGWLNELESHVEDLGRKVDWCMATTRRWNAYIEGERSSISPENDL